MGVYWLAGPLACECYGDTAAQTICGRLNIYLTVTPSLWGFYFPTHIYPLNQYMLERLTLLLVLCLNERMPKNPFPRLFFGLFKDSTKTPCLIALVGVHMTP